MSWQSWFAWHPVKLWHDYNGKEWAFLERIGREKHKGKWRYCLPTKFRLKR